MLEVNSFDIELEKAKLHCDKEKCLRELSMLSKQGCKMGKTEMSHNIFKKSLLEYMNTISRLK